MADLNVTVDGNITSKETPAPTDRVLLMNTEVSPNQLNDMQLANMHKALTQATDTQAGTVRLATDAETITGIATNRALTPANLQALTASDTRDGIVELATNAEAITGMDTARALTPANLTAVLATLTSGSNANVLANGGFRVAQRGAGPFNSTTAPANNDDTYLLDGCILLSDGNDIVDVSQVADTDFVSGYKIRLDVETANKRFGVLLPVENRNIQEIRKSGKASVQFKVKCTGTSMSNVRAYLLAWNSTADTITSDVISAWGSAGADPTFAGNWTAENASTCSVTLVRLLS